MIGILPSSVEVLWTARYDYQPHWRLVRHRHEYFQMIYIVSGSGTLYVRHAEYPIRPGLLLLVKPHSPHSLNPSALVKTLDVKFSVRDSRLRKMLARASVLLEQAEPSIPELFDRIRHEGARKAPLYRELCSVILTELLLHYLRADAGQRKMEISEAGEHGTLGDLDCSGDWIVQQATRFMRDHYAEDCNLTKLARVVGRSDRHIREHFKDILGISPRQYLLQYRIHKAQELIEYSGDAFKEIAAKVGFKTVHHFARAFHETCGETPGAWRRKYQEGICKDVNIDPGFVNTDRTVRPVSNAM